jgi:uncharacterized glyoxalase superfamily protein PhnB
MIDWLCAAFGFNKHLVVPDNQGGITHAQLALGGGMLMLASVREEEFDKLQSTPSKLGGITQSSYIIVADTDAVYRTAKQEGAKIVIDISDQDHGGRGFSCEDPEGHIWSVGSYSPWTD